MFLALLGTLRTVLPKPNLLIASYRYNYATSTLSPDVILQCTQAFSNIEAALTEAGASMKDIVRVRYLLPDRKDFEKCFPVMRQWLGDVKPAATMMQVGLMEEEMKIEIEVTAVKRHSIVDQS